MSKMPVFPGKECPRCHRLFTPGVNGLNRPFGCDRCLGVRRGPDGEAWLPSETRKECDDGEIVTRKVVFG